MSNPYIKLDEAPKLIPRHPICGACRLELEPGNGEYLCPGCGTVWVWSLPDIDDGTLYADWSGETPTGPDGIRALADAQHAVAAHVGGRAAKMRLAVKRVIASQHAPKMPEEPLDLAVRVKVVETGEIFAKCGEYWVGDQGSCYSGWAELWDLDGPVEIIMPDEEGEK